MWPRPGLEVNMTLMGTSSPTSAPVAVAESPGGRAHRPTASRRKGPDRAKDAAYFSPQSLKEATRTTTSMASALLRPLSTVPERRLWRWSTSGLLSGERKERSEVGVTRDRRSSVRRVPCRGGRHRLRAPVRARGCGQRRGPLRGAVEQVAVTGSGRRGTSRGGLKRYLAISDGIGSEAQRC
jgi:hypothetical protein